MKTHSAISIWQRAADFVVVPENGGGGLYFAVEPVERVALTIDELAPALERAAEVSNVSLGVTDLRGAATQGSRPEIEPTV